MSTEQPLSTLPLSGPHTNHLSPSSQARIWQLQLSTNEDSSPSLLEHLHDALHPVVITMAGILVKRREDRSVAEQKELDAVGLKVLRALRMLRLAARWRAQRCALETGEEITVGMAAVEGEEGVEGDGA